jgi:hypothetical protein
MKTLLQDLRYGRRLLLKNRSFATIAILNTGCARLYAVMAYAVTNGQVRLVCDRLWAQAAVTCSA